MLPVELEDVLAIIVVVLASVRVCLNVPAPSPSSTGAVAPTTLCVNFSKSLTPVTKFLESWYKNVVGNCISLVKPCSVIVDPLAGLSTTVPYCTPALPSTY